MPTGKDKGDKPLTDVQKAAKARVAAKRRANNSKK